MIIKEKIGEPLQDSFVKVVVDIEQGLLAYGCDLHIDCAEELMEDGSKGDDLWGANVFPDAKRIDFVSMINIRPARGNREMEIKDADIRSRVEKIIKDLLL